MIYNILCDDLVINRLGLEGNQKLGARTPSLQIDYVSPNREYCLDKAGSQDDTMLAGNYLLRWRWFGLCNVVDTNHELEERDNLSVCLHDEGNELLTGCD